MPQHTVSITEFQTRCGKLIRQVEQAGESLDLTRHGKVVARLVPTTPAKQGIHPWQRLRGHGTLRAKPEESVLDVAEFEAMRNRTGT